MLKTQNWFYMLTMQLMFGTLTFKLQKQAYFFFDLGTRYLDGGYPPDFCPIYARRLPDIRRIVGSSFWFGVVISINWYLCLRQKKDSLNAYLPIRTTGSGPINDYLKTLMFFFSACLHLAAMWRQHNMFCFPWRVYNWEKNEKNKWCHRRRRQRVDADGFTYCIYLQQILSTFEWIFLDAGCPRLIGLGLCNTLYPGVP